MSWRVALTLVAGKDASSLTDESENPLTLSRNITDFINTMLREIPPEEKTFGYWTQLLFVIYRNIFAVIDSIDVLCSSMPLTKQDGVVFDEKYNTPITTTKYTQQKKKKKEKESKLFGNVTHTNVVKRDFDKLEYDVITSDAKSPLVYWWLTRKLLINPDYMVDPFEFADDLMNILNLSITNEVDLKSFMTWIFNIHNILDVEGGIGRTLDLLILPDDRNFIRHTHPFEDEVRSYDDSYYPFLKKNAFSRHSYKETVFTQFPKFRLNKNEHAHLFPFSKNYFPELFRVLDSDREPLESEDGLFLNRMEIIDSQYIGLHFWHNTLIGEILKERGYYHPVINGMKYITLERTLLDKTNLNVASFTILGIIQDTTVTIGKIDVGNIYDYLSTHNLLNPYQGETSKLSKFKLWTDYEIFLSNFYRYLINEYTEYKHNLQYFLDCLDYLGSKNYLTELSLVSLIEEIKNIDKIQVKSTIPFIKRIVEFVLDKLRVKFAKYLKYKKEGALASKNYMLHKLIHQFYFRENFKSVGIESDDLVATHSVGTDEDQERLKFINIERGVTRIESLFRALRTDTDNIYFISDGEEENGTINNFCAFIRRFTAEIEDYTATSDEEDIGSSVTDAKIKERLIEYCDRYDIFEIISKKDAIQKGVSLDEYARDLFDESETVIAGLYKIDNINKGVMAKAVEYAQSLEFYVDAETFEEVDAIKEEWQDYFTDYKDQDNELARLSGLIIDAKKQYSEAKKSGRKEKAKTLKREMNALKSEINSIHDKRMIGKEVVEWMQNNAEVAIILNERSFYLAIYNILLSMNQRTSKGNKEIDLTTNYGKFQADSLLKYPIEQALRRIKDFDPFYPKMIIQKSKINPDGKVSEYYTFSYKPSTMRQDSHMRYSAFQSFIILVFMFEQKIKIKIDGWLKVRDYENIKNWYENNILKRVVNKSVSTTDVFTLIDKKSLLELNGLDEIINYFTTKYGISIVVYVVTWRDKKVRHFDVEVKNYELEKSKKDSVFSFLYFVRKTSSGDISHFEPLEWVENIPAEYTIKNEPEKTDKPDEEKEESESEEEEEERGGGGVVEGKKEEEKPNLGGKKGGGETREEEKSKLGKKLNFEESEENEESELAKAIQDIEDDAKRIKKAKEKSPPETTPLTNKKAIKDVVAKKSKKEKQVTPPQKKKYQVIQDLTRESPDRTGETEEMHELILNKDLRKRDKEMEYLPNIEKLIQEKVQYADGYYPRIVARRDDYSMATIFDADYTYLYKHYEPKHPHHKIITGLLSLLYLISPDKEIVGPWMFIINYEELIEKGGHVMMGKYALKAGDESKSVLEVMSENELTDHETADSLMRYFASKINVGIILYSVESEKGGKEKLTCKVKEYKNLGHEIKEQFAFLYYSNIINKIPNDHFEPLVWVNKETENSNTIKTTHSLVPKIITPEKQKEKEKTPPRKESTPPPPPKPKTPPQKEPTPPLPPKAKTPPQKEPNPPPKEPTPPKKELTPPRKESTPPPPPKPKTPPQKEPNLPPKEPAPPKKELTPPRKESTPPIVQQAPISVEKKKSDLTIKEELNLIDNTYKKDTLLETSGADEDRENLPEKRTRKKTTLFTPSDEANLKRKEEEKKSETRDPATVNSYFGELTIGSMVKVVQYMTDKGFVFALFFIQTISAPLELRANNRSTFLDIGSGYGKVVVVASVIVSLI